MNTITITVFYPEGDENPIQKMNRLDGSKFENNLIVDVEAIKKVPKGKEIHMELIAHALVLHCGSTGLETELLTVLSATANR